MLITIGWQIKYLMKVGSEVFFLFLFSGELFLRLCHWRHLFMLPFVMWMYTWKCIWGEEWEDKLLTTPKVYTETPTCKMMLSDISFQGLLINDGALSSFTHRNCFSWRFDKCETRDQIGSDTRVTLLLLELWTVERSLGEPSMAPSILLLRIMITMADEGLRSTS